MNKYAILGYTTLNIGDDIQSFIASKLVKISYIIMRDDYDQIFDMSGNPCILSEPVFLIMNGWFMHNSIWMTGDDNLKFPIQNSLIRPIYISTCLSKDVPMLYKDDCIKHYKKHEPILCRDSATMGLLNQKGVKTEFFGCLTQTLNVEDVPDNEQYKTIYGDSVIYIDCYDLYNKRDIQEKAYHFKHYYHELYTMNVKKRIDFAIDLLSKYKYAKKIYTRRLHAFLPCRAMGLDVEYVGESNYRVSDLVTKKADKSGLRERFYKYVSSITGDTFMKN